MGKYGHVFPIDSDGKELKILDASRKYKNVNSIVYMDPPAFSNARKFTLTAYHELSHAELFFNGAMHNYYNLQYFSAMKFSQKYFGGLYSSVIDMYSEASLIHFTEHYAYTQEASIGGYNARGRLKTINKTWQADDFGYLNYNYNFLE